MSKGAFVMKLNLTNNYNVTLTLANPNVKIEEIENEIRFAVKEFNIRSRTAKNVKQITEYAVKDNLLLVSLSTKQPLHNPARGLYILPQIIMNDLKEHGKKELADSIMVNKSFFRSVGEAVEIENYKVDEKNVNNKLVSAMGQGQMNVKALENHFNEMSFVLQEVIDLFLSINDDSENREKIEKIKNVLVK